MVKKALATDTVLVVLVIKPASLRRSVERTLDPPPVKVTYYDFGLFSPTCIDNRLQLGEAKAICAYDIIRAGATAIRCQETTSSVASVAFLARLSERLGLFLEEDSVPASNDSVPASNHGPIPTFSSQSLLDFDSLSPWPSSRAQDLELQARAASGRISGRSRTLAGTPSHSPTGS